MIRLILRVCVLMVAVQGAWGALEFEQDVLSATLPLGAERYPFTFSFKNGGDEALEVVQVKPSCGCTTTELDKLSYRPGDSGVIEGLFKVGSRVGQQKLTVSVITSNAVSGVQTHELALQLEIPQMLESSPSMLLWRVGAEAKEKAIRIKLASAESISIEKLRVASEEFVARLEEGATPDEKQSWVAPASTAIKASGLWRWRPL